MIFFIFSEDHILKLHDISKWNEHIGSTTPSWSYWYLTMPIVFLYHKYFLVLSPIFQPLQIKNKGKRNKKTLPHFEFRRQSGRYDIDVPAIWCSVYSHCLKRMRGNIYIFFFIFSGNGWIHPTLFIWWFAASTTEKFLVLNMCWQLTLHYYSTFFYLIF